jgi:hypothetical protein
MSSRLPSQLDTSTPASWSSPSWAPSRARSRGVPGDRTLGRTRAPEAETSQWVRSSEALALAISSSEYRTASGRIQRCGRLVPSSIVEATRSVVLQTRLSGNDHTLLHETQAVAHHESRKLSCLPSDCRVNSVRFECGREDRIAQFLASN